MIAAHTKASFGAHVELDFSLACAQSIVATRFRKMKIYLLTPDKWISARKGIKFTMDAPRACADGCNRRKISEMTNERVIHCYA